MINNQYINLVQNNIKFHKLIIYLLKIFNIRGKKLEI
jgi:hypothetical protein